MLMLPLPSPAKQVALTVPRPPPAQKVKAVGAAPLVFLLACLLTVPCSNFFHRSPGPSKEPTTVTTKLVMLMRWEGATMAQS